MSSLKIFFLSFLWNADLTLGANANFMSPGNLPLSPDPHTAPRSASVTTKRLPNE